MSTEIAKISLSDMEKMATTLAKSELFGIKNPTQALALMLVSQAEGLHPVIAARDYHIINGRPSLKADAMLARHIASGGSVVWHELSRTKACATFIHPSGGEAKIEWTLEDAKKAGLLDKRDSVWNKYPRGLLRSRCVSEGVRTVNPGCICGSYAPEEVQSFSPIPKSAEEAKEVFEVIEEDLISQENKCLDTGSEYESYESSLRNSKDLEMLKISYIEAYRNYVNYPEIQEKLKIVKDEVKEKLTQGENNGI